MAQPVVFFEIHSFNEFVGRAHNQRFYVGNETISFARDIMGVQQTIDRTYKESTPDPPRVVVPFLRINSEKKPLPKYPGQGYVFRSDSKKCGILIGTRDEGVSGMHFTIELHERPGVLKVKDFSTHGTAARQPNDEFSEPIKGQTTLERGSHNCPGIMYIHIPGVQIELRIPISSTHKKDFEAAWAQTYKMCQDDERSLNSLDIAPPPSSTQAPVNSYVLQTCIGNCETGKVFIAKHRNKWRKLYTVKQWKKLIAAEYEVHVLSRIEHVSTLCPLYYPS